MELIETLDNKKRTEEMEAKRGITQGRVELRRCCEIWKDRARLQKERRIRERLGNMHRGL